MIETHFHAGRVPAALPVTVAGTGFSQCFTARVYVQSVHFEIAV